jgi:serine/threonine protein kinase
MVREVSALFQLLRENSRRETSQYRNFKKPERYIVDFYDAFSNPEDGVVCLMIEYMDGGSLQDIVNQGGCDDEVTLANISIQALKGLSFLHSCSQIHRDLKPGNFLISHRGEVKVADLGIMKQLPPKLPGQLQKTNTFVGTATYMSPERIDGKDYSFPADVWAFGLSMMTIALGKLPIDTHGGYWTILHSIRDKSPPTLPNDRFSPEFRDFIHQCLQKNPEDRAACKDLLKHEFLLKAEPEDLTQDQDDERGKHELTTILQAVIKHIESLKKIYSEKYKNNVEKYKENTSNLHEKLFGNLLENSTADILNQILFYNNHPPIPAASNPAGAATSSNNSVGGTSVTKHRLTKPRLNTLARQLNLPLQVVISHSKLFCEKFGTE